MARVRLVLDTRNTSKNQYGLYPIAIRLFHGSTRLIRLGYSTALDGWDDRNSLLKKSNFSNRGKDCDKVQAELEEKLVDAKAVIYDLGNSIDNLNVSDLVTLIKEKWDVKIKSIIRERVDNDLTLNEWGNTIKKRKLNANKPGTAKWYNDGITAFTKFTSHDIKLFDINVTLLKNFEAFHLGKGNSKGTIGIYLKAIRSLYNGAINEGQFVPTFHAFEKYKIPTGGRSKKRVVVKNKIMDIKNLAYKKESALWHAKNYTLIMFYCRGMNFIDLVKIKAKNITGGRLYYGRSKTGDPLSVKITDPLQEILEYYLCDKESEHYLFPTNYDGSSKDFQKYHTQRRRMNERLKIIAKDAGIEGNFTTYYIRHSWATIAKYMGISTAIISEGLGHSSIRTTEIYLKDFDDDTLDAANELIVA